MKNKLLLILKYILTLIESLSLFLLTILLIFNITILNPDYIINKMDKTKYYNKLYKDIKLEMSYYTNQSGFNDNILDDIFTKEDIKNSTRLFINNLYKGKETNIDTNNIKTSINNNINAFLKKYNYNITNRKEIDTFINKMTDIYIEKIKIITNSDKIAPTFYKVLKYKNIAIISLIVLLIITLIINKLLCKTKHFDIVMYINSLLFTIISLYIRNKIDINNLYIYNTHLSNILKITIKNILDCYIVVIITYLIIGIFISIINIKADRKD